MECTRCGTCCVAPDIAALDKPLGVRCEHLTDALSCAIYPDRPAICRHYQPDAVCERVAAPTLEERVQRYLTLFGLWDEAQRLRRAGVCSMRAARAHEPATR